MTVHTSALGYAAGFLVATQPCMPSALAWAGLWIPTFVPWRSLSMAVAGFGMIAGVL
jgi:hypothetical protein